VHHTHVYDVYCIGTEGIVGMRFQVAGELSNAGQPMRRFMQTFILAPQSPKKYYVHNDIFRYQDEVFHDIAMDSEPDTAGKFLY